MWLVFVAASVTCVGGCAALGNRRADSGVASEGVEIVKKGDPAPDDGFWLSRQTFLMLYEAAEKSLVSPDAASQPKAGNRVESRAPGLPSTAGQVPQPKGKPE